MSPDVDLRALADTYLASVLGFALAFVLLAYVLRQHERPSASIAWLLAIVLLPVVGVPAYLLFAGRKVRGRARRKQPLHSLHEHGDAGIGGTGGDIEGIVRGYGMPGASDGNRVTMLTSGEQAYRTLLARIDGAERSIHVTTFELGHDAVGREIVERLAAKAADGVEVRLLVDAIGTVWARFGMLRRLERSGGQVGVFMRVLPLRRKWKANLRNHRKMAVFDERTAIVGGMNLARRYMGPGEHRRHWIDTGVLLEGPAVEDLCGVFADDWAFATDESLQLPESVDAVPGGAQIVQVVPSGPDVEHDPLYDAVVAAVYKARRRVWLVTPYFVPDEGLMRALTMQARMGSDVRIVLPRRSDHVVADMARARFVRTLGGAGARFFAHPSRMIHAKHVLVDDDLWVSGSANLDMRSLYLNYEIALFCYDRGTIDRTAAWIRDLLASCRDYAPREPGFLRRLGEDLCWLASPLL